MTTLNISYDKLMIYIFYTVSAPTSAPSLTPTSAPTRIPTSTPTLIPTSAPTVSIASIQLEGNAMADIARAIPGLTTLSGMD